MTVLHACILGLIQGITEYIPVSSSAHLALATAFFGWGENDAIRFSFDVLVQLGTLFSVILYFSDDLFAIGKSMLRDLFALKPLQHPLSRLGWLIGVATIPAVIVGLLFKTQIAHSFASPKYISGLLIITAILLILAETLSKTFQSYVRLPHAIGMGLAQALAVFPGISRSGSTMSAGMLLGLKRKAAARFSFLMSIPVMVGASIVTLNDLINVPQSGELIGPFIAGFVSAAISGYMVIKWFLEYVQHQSLRWFALYSVLVGVWGLWYF